ncbi:cell division ATP-binding protein FtsE [Culicoidibacter larvae]|uniref:Cell division ATP-binding protein FtsE n=1 Tax=Culicoidibacter larvae TaxID=2579976 RepID=A0A5R8QGJ5_9FIRM|nr:cell division ATP-binding protein FtsE [Culicoidibacter larvae]TLG77118.1 cell division ATP-binding protein FtsE [Culicoidibacter larvae]
MIQLANVTKVYNKNMHALNNISVTINDGEFVYVVGHSGAGKSTFIRLLYREEKSTKGDVIVNGKNVSKIRNSKVPLYRRTIGVVFQDFKLLQNRTAFENVAFALEVHGEKSSDIRRKVRDALEVVGLKGKAKQLPHQLSGGEQQRVAIARAIVNRPSILIADEPTGNLDPVTSRSIMDVLEAINQMGTTVVMATHDVHLVNEMPKRTLTFNNGTIYSDVTEGGYFVDESL